MKHHFSLQHKLVAYELVASLAEGIDNIAYTDRFETLYQQFRERTSSDTDRNYVHCLFMYARKHPRKESAGTSVGSDAG